jgi:signal transduction histidine kinase
MLRALALLTIVLYGQQNVATAQFNSFIHYTTADGLPSSEVYEVFQDKTGFIWFATDNGVVRFDGRNMEIFQGAEGLPDPVVFGFFEDTKGRIWFRSFSGRLSYFENSRILLYKYNSILTGFCQQSLLYSISVDSLDQVSFRTDNFIGKITATGKVEAANPSPTPRNTKNSGNERTTLWRGKRYVSYQDILFQLDSDGMHKVFQGKDQIISLSADQDDHLWIGYFNSDLERYADETFKNSIKLDFLNQKSVTSVLHDRTRGFWMSTLQDGVFYVPHLNYSRHELPMLSKIKVARVAGKNIIVADDNQTVILLDGQRFEIRKKISLPHQHILSIFSDSRKNYWISSKTNVSIFDSLLVLRNVIPLHLKDFYEDEKGYVWGFNNARIYKFATDGSVVHSLDLNDIHRGILASKPYIIMTGRTGFDVFDSELKLVRSPEIFRNYKISGISNLNDTTLLVATIGSGFFIVNKNNWLADQYVTGKKFIASNIYSVSVLDSALWLGTEKGIAITSLSSILDKKPNFFFLSKKNGLMSEEVSFLIFSKPNILAFSDHGFNSIPGQTRDASRLQTKFYLKQILINSKIKTLQRDSTLSYDQNSIQIKFGFIDFANQIIFVRSRLSPGRPWNYSTERSLAYNNLAPSSYALELEYATDAMHWVPANTGIRFTIAAAWWQRWYVQLAFFIFVLLIVYSFFRFRVTSLRQKNLHLKVLNDHKQNLIQAEISTLERERSRIAKDLHDGIGMSLAVIKLNLNKLNLKYTEAEITEIESDLSSTIQEIRDIIYNLTPAGLTWHGLAEVLDTYIHRSVDRIGIKIDLIRSGDDVKDPKISLFAFRIVQELLTNSIKHSGANHISIEVSSGKSLSIIYKDNGKGFIPDSAPKGSGLLNIQARLESLGATAEFTQGKPGVVYTIEIPLIVSREKYP